MKIVFFGTSKFAAEILSFLANKPLCDLAAVVTRPDKHQGRHLKTQFSPVKQRALSLKSSIPLFQPSKASTEEFKNQLAVFKPDLFVVVAYGEIIKQDLLDLPKYGSINIHASLLPKYRGAAPIQRAIMEGEKITGITIIQMVPKMDAGPILGREEIPIDENATFDDLEPKLIHAACSSVIKAIEKIAHGTATKLEQMDDQATYASKIAVCDEKIDWHQPAQDLHNLIRALSSRPGAWCKVRIGDHEKRMKIYRTLLVRSHQGSPGKIIEKSKNRLLIACGKDALDILLVQIEGKKAMQIQDFLSGLQQSLEFTL